MQPIHGGTYRYCTFDKYLRGGENPSFISPYKDLPTGEYIINFSATDTRYDASNSNSPSRQALTTEFNASLSIIATPPTLVLNPFESNAPWITENETVEYTDPYQGGKLRIGF